MRRLLIVLLGLAVLAPQASSAPRPRDLWATVNVCDTEAHPDAMGVRARMPGNGTRQRMYMRFRAFYFDEATSRWSAVGGNARSGWIHVGSARVRHREAGYTFRFDPPMDGRRFIVRGVVDFRWRDTRIRRRAQVNTKGGFESTRGADPPGYTAGVCEIR